MNLQVPAFAFAFPPLPHINDENENLFDITWPFNKILVSPYIRFPKDLRMSYYLGSCDPKNTGTIPPDCRQHQDDHVTLVLSYNHKISIHMIHMRIFSQHSTLQGIHPKFIPSLLRDFCQFIPIIPMNRVKTVVNGRRRQSPYHNSPQCGFFWGSDWRLQQRIGCDDVPRNMSSFDDLWISTVQMRVAKNHVPTSANWTKKGIPGSVPKAHSYACLSLVQKTWISWHAVTCNSVLEE